MANKFTQADELSGLEKREAIRELKEVNAKCSFATVIFGEIEVVGYKTQEVKEKIGTRTEVDDLFDKLKTINEPIGYFLNGELEKTFVLLSSLLTNKKRYGYMACPCRLFSGLNKNDADIIFPPLCV